MVKALNTRKGLSTGTGLVSIVDENGNISSSAGMDNTPIGNTTRSTGKFTTLDANSAVTLTANTSSGSTTTGTLVVTGGVGISQNVWIGGTLDSAGTASLNALTIKGNSLVIGNTSTDVAANGGGITLTGLTNKTILWDSANANWTSNQSLNVASGKDYRINNTVVLNATTLGSGVVTSSLTTVGTIGTGTWQGSVISATYLDSAVARLAGPQTHTGTHTFSSPPAFTQATGTAPFTVSSTTVVTNLNANTLQGNLASAFYLASNPSNYITASQTTSASGGDVTWSATALSSAINATIASSAVTLAKMANLTGPTVIGLSTGTAAPVALSMATLSGASMLNLGQYLLATNGTVTNPINTDQTLTDASDVSWNMNSGQIATLTFTTGVGATRNFCRGTGSNNPPSNLKKGTYVLYLKQPASGGPCSIANWGTMFKWTGGSAPVLSTAANAVDIITFVSDGTNLYGSAMLDVR